jgi:glycerate dehydrogenase
MPKIVVLDGHALNPGDLDWNALKKLGDLEIYGRTPESEVIGRAGEAEVVFTNKTPLTATTLGQLPLLRYVGVLATGYNVVDVKAATARGVIVTNIPTYGTDSVAQFAIALLLELCHRVGLHDQAVRVGEWTRNPDWSLPKSPLVELSGKTMGIVGFGQIGRQTAKIADALGMRVIAAETNRVDAPEWPGFRWSGVEELLADSDVVSLHCPLFPETQGLINAQRLALMRRTAFLINTSRGPLVVERDLADALNLEWIAGAAVDVLSAEPPLEGSYLFAAKNCIVTPHIAWATKEARSRLMDAAVQNLASYLHGTPVNVVS